MKKNNNRVDPNVYTREYYLTDCTGFDEFTNSLGEELEPRFKELIKHFNIRSGMKVLDIGCGRGEMVLYAAKNGATGVGIDYSVDAIRLAKEMKKNKDKNIRERMKFLVMDAKKLQFTKNMFDIVILTDVVEHLYPPELNKMMKEIRRVIKREGIIVMHTAPNKLFVDYGYKYFSYPLSSLLVNFWNLVSGRNYANIAKPSDLRTDSHSVMHINEPTFFSLMKLFSYNGFKGSIRSSNVTSKKQEISIKDNLFNLIVFLHPLSKRAPLNILFGSDFISILRRQK